MTRSQTIWILGALFIYAIALSALLGTPTLRQSEGIWRMAHGVLYGAFGAILLGAIARGFPHVGPNVWRSTTLVVGAAAAGAGAWITHRSYPAVTFDAWMAALLGLAVAVMLPRWLPESATRWWLGIERRHESHD